MKVLVVLDSLSFGGAENLLVPLSRASGGADFTIDVVTVAPRIPNTVHLAPRLEAAGVPVSHLGIPRLLHPAALPRLRRAVARSGCDVVHAHLEAACTLAPVAAALAGRPAVCTFHHVPQQMSGRAAARERLSVEAASRSRRVLFVSEASREAFASRYGGRRTWSVLPNGVDLDVFSPAGNLPTVPLPVPEHAPVVALVAAMREPKGHATAVAAWVAVRRAVPDARLLLVGGGEEEDRLRRQVAELDLQDRVVFAGIRHDVPEVLRAADLVVLPSCTEALPTTLIEAAACGRPAVATDVGGVREVVDDGRTGVLVPPHDPPALAAAVVDLLQDPRRRAEMGRRARRLAEERFDMHDWVRRLRVEYDEALRPLAAGEHRRTRQP